MPRLPVKIRQASDGSQWITTRELEENIFGSSRRTMADQTRRYFGSSITPEVIESVIRMSDNGYMRDLTDLTKETINFDPHFATVVSKRFRALASVKLKVVQAEGPGVDPTRAAQYADEVRVMLARIRNFRQQVIRLNWGHCNGRAALEKVWRENRGGPAKYTISEMNWIQARRQSLGPDREIRVRDDVWGGCPFEAKGLDIENIPHKFIAYKPQLFDDVTEREGFGPRGLYYSFFKRFSWRERMILIEVFGKPWRHLEIDVNAPYKDGDLLNEMQERVDEMGANSSAALAPGVHLKTENADPKSTDPHDRTSDKCDDQISKLVLGNTRTTDAKADGLGGQQSLVHQDGETLVITADGWGIADCLTEQLALDYVVLNYGEDEAINAPTIELAYESTPDQTVEIDRAVKVFGLGIPLKVEEVYRRTGWEKPEPGDEVLTQQSTPSAVPGGLPSTSLKPSVVDDPAKAEPGKEGADGLDPSVPLARNMASSLRLSRLSRDYFSGR